MTYKYKDLIIESYYKGYRIYLPYGNSKVLVAITDTNKKDSYRIGKEQVDYLNSKGGF